VHFTIDRFDFDIQNAHICVFDIQRFYLVVITVSSTGWSSVSSFRPWTELAAGALSAAWPANGTTSAHQQTGA
jgi:hypothetical protein